MPFTAFLVTAKESERCSLSRKPVVRYNNQNSDLNEEQAEIFNETLDSEEKARLQKSLDKKMAWQKAKVDKQKEYHLLSSEEKEILRDGEYYNRRGYYKFLKSKKLEKLNSELKYLEAKVSTPWNNVDLYTSDQFEKMPSEF